MDNGYTRIDVKQVLANKAPKTAGKIPGFVINYLIRTIHQDELNDILFRYRDKQGTDFMESLLDYFDLKLETVHPENIPDDRRCIFASNHPLGGLDGIATGYIIGKHYDGRVRFFSNDLMMFLTPMKDMFIPVNKFGNQSKEHAEMMQKLYESDNNLVTYPAGMCSRKQNGKICDLEWKKNFITKAVQFKRDVVPVYFEGKNSKFFYNLANLRKFLGIKFNIEMMYLPDEMFKQKGNKFTIKIGKPIPWQTFDRSKSHAEWAEWVKDIVYKMK